MPEVSVLMPVYNVQQYVAEAIESILNQTFSDFELIILDDCSVDNTTEIVKSYSDPRIIYHRNNINIGLAENLNIGLKIASGTLIARMDGDDISLPTRLQVQVDFLENNPDIDLCSCGMILFGPENKTWIRDRDPEQVKISMMFYSAILHASSVFRKKSFEKHNLVYNPDAFPAEDYDLWSRAVFHCKLLNIPDVLYQYRIHDKQVTSTDDRSIVKCRVIQINYIQKALPELRKNDIINFIDNFILKEPQNLSDILKNKELNFRIIRANKKNKFFHLEKLKLTLKKYHQHMVFNYLKSFKINGILDLLLFIRIMFMIRFKLIAKLLHYKL